MKFRENELLLEAALCAWEWMFGNSRHELIQELWDGLGASAMRHCAMQAGEIALNTYDLMRSKDIEFHSAYDWEFVPAVMIQLDWEKLVEHNQYNGPAYEPDLEAILTAIMTDNKDFETPRQRWIDQARREATKQWGYADLVSDHEEKIDLTETPQEWVRRIGEKYDLEPIV